jgi:hypothetical protein
VDSVRPNDTIVHADANARANAYLDAHRNCVGHADSNTHFDADAFGHADVDAGSNIRPDALRGVAAGPRHDTIYHDHSRSPSCPGADRA